VICTCDLICDLPITDKSYSTRSRPGLRSSN